jgi:hypothetical protein
MQEKQQWIVKRYVVEIYEAYGDTREEAITYVHEHGDPHSVLTKNETAVKAK